MHGVQRKELLQTNAVMVLTGFMLSCFSLERQPQDAHRVGLAGTERKLIFKTDLSPEGDVLKTLTVTFSGPQAFRDYLTRGWIPGLGQRQPPELEPMLAIEYDHLQVGCKILTP